MSVNLGGCFDSQCIRKRLLPCDAYACAIYTCRACSMLSVGLYYWVRLFQQIA